MPRWTRILSAAAVPVALAAAAGLAGAAPAPPNPLFTQKVKCRAGRFAFSDNTPRAERLPFAQYEVLEGRPNQFRLLGRFEKLGKTGTGRQAQLALVVQGMPDPRTATYPARIPVPGDGTTVRGGYTDTVIRDVLRGPEVELVPTETSWIVNSGDPDAFRIDVRKWDAATNRLSGKFTGTLVPGDGSPEGTKPLRIAAGNFVVVVEFLGGEPPPEPTAK